MYLPIERIMNGETARREAQPNNEIYLGEKKNIAENDEVKTFKAIMIRNTISGDCWVWIPSHLDLIANDYIIDEKDKKDGK